MKKGNGVTRKYAEKLLAEIPKIASSINKDDKQYQHITKIAVYGSFISTDKEILGDLDLAVEVMNKYENVIESKEFRELFNSGSYIERLFKSGNYINKCLVNGKKCLHINPYEVLKASNLSEGTGYIIIYSLE